MKIAYITQSYPPMISGAAIVVHRLAQNMAARGHTILVIAASDTGAAYNAEEDHLKLVRLASTPNPKRANQYFAAASFGQVNLALRNFQPDIIHLHDLLSLGLVGLRCGKARRIPIVATIHQLPWFISAYLPPLPGLQPSVEQFLWLYSRWLNRQCTSMIVPTHTIARTVESKAGFGSTVISNGVDLERFRPAPQNTPAAQSLRCALGLDPNKKIILHLGRLDVDKCVDVVIHAAAKAMRQTEAQLLVVGDGECRDALIALTRRLGIGRSSYFPGFVDHQFGVPEIYQIATVFTTASEIETQGLVLLEALASGLPVVAVKATCIPEIVKQDYNGYTVRSGDVEAMADSLVQVLQEPQRARQMGEAGRDIALSHAIPNTINKHEALYQSILTTTQPVDQHQTARSKASPASRLFEFYQSFLAQIGRR